MRSLCSLGTRSIGSNRKIFRGIGSRFSVSHKASPLNIQIFVIYRFTCVSWWLSGKAQPSIQGVDAKSDTDEIGADAFNYRFTVAKLHTEVAYYIIFAINTAADSYS